MTFTISVHLDHGGVGFNAEKMADEPYAIIVDGNGKVSERKLGNHAPGKLLPNTLTVLSNSVKNNIHTVTITRAIVASDEMSYLKNAGNLNVITAIGSTVELSYHKERTGAMIVLLPQKINSCLYQPNIKQFITYESN